MHGYLMAVVLALCAAYAQTAPPARAQTYENEETRQLVALVSEAAGLIRTQGEDALGAFRTDGSKWRQGEQYIFVLDPDGNMVVHPDPALEGTNQLSLKDVNGKPIVQGLIQAASTGGKPDGWYHYEWPVPGGLLPRWKSTYVRLVTTPSGHRYVVGSGMYNDRMERAFVVDAVDGAVAEIERTGTAAFPLFKERTGSFIAKDSYVFVVDSTGTELVNPAFPNLEGRNLLDLKDTNGKRLIREMLQVVDAQGAGWVDYMWPKPGESVSTQKSAYVRRARLGDTWVLVGSGVYLEGAPTEQPSRPTMIAPELMTLVREAAAVLEQEGEGAYAQFRRKGTKWFHDDTYVFVWTLDGTRVFHGADPSIEGRDVRDIKDAVGRPFGRMILQAAATPTGEGWLHYVYPEPGGLFPAWKSTFVKRVTYPAGGQFIVGCGIYNMEMSKAFITDIVDRAAALIAARGTAAFPELRDKRGAFVFMDTYVFVDTADGVELVNGGHPSVEGKNLMAVEDPTGKPIVRDYIAAALEHGSAWVDYSWYLPGTNRISRKESYVRRVEAGGVTYIVGSGLYVSGRRLD